MIIKEEISIGGKIEIVTANLEIFEIVINKKISYQPKLRFDIKLNCEVDGIEIETIYIERLFELSQQTFDKILKQKK
jgi:hypothetical protein